MRTMRDAYATDKRMVVPAWRVNPMTYNVMPYTEATWWWVKSRIVWPLMMAVLVPWIESTGVDITGWGCESWTRIPALMWPWLIGRK